MIKLIKFIVIIKNKKNTYENLNLINQILIKENIKNVNIITSPIHTKRVKLIWNKNFNQISLSLLKTTDSYYDTYGWGSSYSKLKAVTYEYLAIFYNFYRKWI